MVVATLLPDGRRVTLHEEVGASAREVVEKITAEQWSVADPPRILDGRFVRSHHDGWVRVGAIVMLEDDGLS